MIIASFLKDAISISAKFTMKFAKSIRYAGELIPAEKCDYSSYKDLGLICPECNNSVLLVREQKRNRGETQHKVSAHFKHFPKHKLIAETCELRVNSYSAKDIQKAENKARGQRLKFFQKWFFKIVDQTTYADSGQTIQKLNENFWELWDTEPYFKERVNKLYDQLTPLLKQEQVQNKYFNFVFSVFSSDKEVIILTDEGANEKIKKIWQEITSEITLEQHLKICKEALNYALTPRNRERFCSLMWGALSHILLKEGENKLFILDNKTTKIHCDCIVALIAFIPWSKKFQELTTNK